MLTKTRSLVPDATNQEPSVRTHAKTAHIKISSLLATASESIATSGQGRPKAARYMGFSATADGASVALRAIAIGRVGQMGRDGDAHQAGQPMASGAADLVLQIKLAEASKKTPTVAVDLDGTIAKQYDEFDPKEIPEPRVGAKKALEEFKERGWRVIINTVRGDDTLTKKYLDSHNIPWDFVNENPDQPEGASDKLIADVYIDDRGIDARKAWTKVKSETIQRIEKQGELAAWEAVPGLVRVRFKEAATIQKRLSRVIKHLPSSDYGDVYWNSTTKGVWVVLGDSDTEQTYQKWHNAIKAVSGVKSVRAEAEYGPHGDDNWIRIKSAGGALGILNKPYEWAGKMTGGPSPMSNAIVSGLLGAGAGYLGGMAAEHLLPEEYVRRGRLRKLLAGLGGAAGVGSEIPGAMTNAAIARTAGKPMGMSTLWTSTNRIPMAPHELDLRSNFYKTSEWQAMKAALPDPPELFMRSAAGFCKVAFTGVTGSPGVPLRPVPVDAFNRAIWNDVHNGLRSSSANPYGMGSPHTPPMIGAAVGGLVSGVQQQYGGAPVLHPKHFISGLANAGLDLAVAKVAGGVLGALGGLTPAGQKKIQDLGLWGGLMRGVAGSVFGLR